MTDFVVVNRFSKEEWLYTHLIVYKGSKYYISNSGRIMTLGPLCSIDYYKGYKIRKLTKLEKLIYFGEKE